jgi:hypothetical protein
MNDIAVRLFIVGQGEGTRLRPPTRISGQEVFLYPPLHISHNQEFPP